MNTISSAALAMYCLLVSKIRHQSLNKIFTKLITVDVFAKEKINICKCK